MIAYDEAQKYVDEQLESVFDSTNKDMLYLRCGKMRLVKFNGYDIEEAFAAGFNKAIESFGKFAKIDGWIAKDGKPAGGNLFLFSEKPEAPKSDSFDEIERNTWGHENENGYFDHLVTELDPDDFPDITFENSPKKVELLIKL